MSRLLDAFLAKVFDRLFSFKADDLLYLSYQSFCVVFIAVFGLESNMTMSVVILGSGLFGVMKAEGKLKKKDGAQ